MGRFRVSTEAIAAEVSEVSEVSEMSVVSEIVSQSLRLGAAPISLERVEMSDGMPRDIRRSITDEPKLYGELAGGLEMRVRNESR